MSGQSHEIIEQKQQQHLQLVPILTPQLNHPSNNPSCRLILPLNKQQRAVIKFWPENDDEDDDENERGSFNISFVDHSWSKKILELVKNKARLIESFSRLSTLGGGFSSLGEQNKKFSARAGALSLGQQLHLAELLGDERLKIMCHLFAVIAALQLDELQFCRNYIRKVILPLIESMPYRDMIIMNILKHINFRLSTQVIKAQNAIENKKPEKKTHGNSQNAIN